MKPHCTICGTLRSNCRHGVPFCSRHEAPRSKCECAMYACTDCGKSWYGLRTEHDCYPATPTKPNVDKEAAV